MDFFTKDESRQNHAGAITIDDSDDDFTMSARELGASTSRVEKGMFTVSIAGCVTDILLWRLNVFRERKSATVGPVAETVDVNYFLRILYCGVAPPDHVRLINSQNSASFWLLQ